MPQEELFNTRDRSYSAWHRRNSTRRFIGIDQAQLCAMIDLDASVYVEYDDGTKEPLALIETARDVGQSYKSATVTLNLAKLCTARTIPVFVVLYSLSDSPNPADPQWKDISKFRVKRLWPDTEFEWKTLTPAQWAERLMAMRKWSASKVDEQYAQTL